MTTATPERATAGTTVPAPLLRARDWAVRVARVVWAVIGPVVRAIGRFIAPVFRVITPAGWLVLGVGALALALSFVFGWQEFTYLGTVLLAAAVLSSFFLFGRASYGVDIELNPRRVVVGDRAMGRMVVTNTGAAQPAADPHGAAGRQGSRRVPTAGDEAQGRAGGAVRRAHEQAGGDRRRTGGVGARRPARAAAACAEVGRPGRAVRASPHRPHHAVGGRARARPRGPGHARRSPTTTSRSTHCGRTCPATTAATCTGAPRRASGSSWCGSSRRRVARSSR